MVNAGRRRRGLHTKKVSSILTKKVNSKYFVRHFLTFYTYFTPEDVLDQEDQFTAGLYFSPAVQADCI
jgi:argonaute-like protein implicated in RNA metabolism and viral defense